MNDERQSLSGCILWFGIIMVVWAGFRVENIIQFLVMASIIFVGLLVAIWALTTYAKGGFGNALLALFYTYLAVNLLVIAGNFLRTGDYDESMKPILSRFAPAPTAVVESNSTAASAQSTPVVQATNPPSSSQNSSEGGTQDDGISLPIPSPVKEIWKRISASTASSHPVSEQFEIWRLAMGVILGLQFVVGFYVARHTRQRHVTRNFIFYGILSALLMFTKAGEWVYSIFTAVSGWGTWGYILMILAVAVIGLVGLIIAMMGFNNTIGYILVGTICAYVVTGFMYHNIQMLQYCVLPSIIMMLIVLYIAIYQARYRRYLKFG